MDIVNRSSALVLAWMMACGAGGEQQVRVTLQTLSPPLLVGFRPESSSSWQMLNPDGKSSFEFSVTGPYRIVVACGNSSGGIGVNEYARTPADAPTITFFCGTARFMVNGTVSAPGLVGLGVQFATTSAQLGFQLPAAAGTFDLVHLFAGGVDQFDRIGIMRDVAITGNTDLGLIDLSRSSQNLVPASFTVTNLAAGETVAANIQLYAGNSIFPIPGSTPPASVGTVPLIPEGLLRATDRQVLDLQAGMSVSGVTMIRRFRRDTHVGDPATVALPDPLGAVTFTLTGDRLAATASSLPDHDQIFLSRQSDAAGPGVNAHGMVVSRTFLEASGAATTILDLSDVPGLQPAWRIDPSTQRFIFTASRGSSTDSMTTSSTAIRFSPGTQIRSASGRLRASLSPDEPVGVLSE